MGSRVILGQTNKQTNRDYNFIYRIIDVVYGGFKFIILSSIQISISKKKFPYFWMVNKVLAQN